MVFVEVELCLDLCISIMGGGFLGLERGVDVYFFSLALAVSTHHLTSSLSFKRERN